MKFRPIKTNMRYKLTGREEGRGKPFIKTFSKLVDLQTYIKDRWQGAEYMDGPRHFHTDYVAYFVTGCMLSDLGELAGAFGTDEYWNWNWKNLEEKNADTKTV